MFSFSKLAILGCATLALTVNASSSIVQPIAPDSLPVRRVTSDLGVPVPSPHLSHRAVEDPFEDALFVREIRAQLEDHIKRSYIPEEQDLNERWIAAVVRGAAQIIMKVVNLVKGKIEHDKQERGKFTMHVVNEGRKEKPDMNWIACHTKHRTAWKGAKGKDWNHMHQEFDVSFHKTVGYEIYWAREGEFWNEGDGGYLNWAFAGKFKREGNGGKHVIFMKN